MYSYIDVDTLGRLLATLSLPSNGAAVKTAVAALDTDGTGMIEESDFLDWAEQQKPRYNKAVYTSLCLQLLTHTPAIHASASMPVMMMTMRMATATTTLTHRYQHHLPRRSQLHAVPLLQAPAHAHSQELELVLAQALELVQVVQVATRSEPDAPSLATCPGGAAGPALSRQDLVFSAHRHPR